MAIVHRVRVCVRVRVTITVVGAGPAVVAAVTGMAGWPWGEGPEVGEGAVPHGTRGSGGLSSSLLSTSIGPASVTVSGWGGARVSQSSKFTGIGLSLRRRSFKVRLTHREVKSDSRLVSAIPWVRPCFDKLLSRTNLSHVTHCTLSDDLRAFAFLTTAVNYKKITRYPLAGCR